jgi:hypothetical protein
MLYLLAAVGAITVVVLLWRAFGANPAQAVERRPRRAEPIAPDDDPDFLRRLGEQKKPKPPQDGDGSQPPSG